MTQYSILKISVFQQFSEMCSAAPFPWPMSQWRWWPFFCSSWKGDQQAVTTTGVGCHGWRLSTCWEFQISRNETPYGEAANHVILMMNLSKHQIILFGYIHVQKVLYIEIHSSMNNRGYGKKLTKPTMALGNQSSSDSEDLIWFPAERLA